MKNFLRGLAQIFFLLIFIMLLLLFGLFWFDYLGLTRSKNLINKIIGRVGLTLPEKRSQSENFSLEEERVKSQKKALNLQIKELNRQKEELEKLKQNVKKERDSVEIKNKKLEEKETSLNQILKQYDNRKINLKQSVANLNGMPPEKAVAILSEMNESDAVDILRTADKVAKEKEEVSLVPYWISLMASPKGASIQHLLVISPNEEKEKK